MKIEIKDRWAQLVEDDTLRQNAEKLYNVEFVFSDEWSGFSKIAVFEAGPASVIVALSEDRCTIPAECLKYGSVKLKIGVYGVRGDERKPAVWCLASMIIPDASIDAGSSGRPPTPDDVYSEIMAAIGDLSAAGFEGKTLAEVFREIKNSVCETATDPEVEDMLETTFGSTPTLPDNPGGEEGPDNTATDEEVDDILDEVFGK